MSNFLPGQKLMIAWLKLMQNYTPYDAGVGKEAWDIWHERLKEETSNS